MRRDYSSIKITAQVQPHHQGIEAMREAWRKAESLGVDGLFNWDHLAPRFGDLDGAVYECWTTLGAMAMVTKAVQIGPAVSAITLRNPALLADMARTVDLLSGGRLVLGLGAGGWERDLVDAGYPLGTPRSRLAELERAIPVIRERWQVKNPPPVNGSIPIMIGSNGERVGLRIVAEHADSWNCQGDPDDAARLNRVLDDWCAKVGRDPEEIERSMLLIRPYQVDLVDEYVEAGFRHFIYSVRAPDNDFAPVERLLEWRG
ncbi:MAG: LLM class F420-dependent oxidoreductase [Thermomicrobiales bacterium]